jgi:hypothetical protein
VEFLIWRRELRRGRAKIPRHKNKGIIPAPKTAPGLLALIERNRKII